MSDLTGDIINGDFCEVCGEVLESEGMGFPRKCEDCEADDE